MKKTILTEVKGIEGIPEELKNGVHCQMISFRNKDNEGMIKSEKDELKKYNNKLISRNIEEFNDNINTLGLIVDKCPAFYRIYSTVNSFDVNKAIRKFKYSQLDNDGMSDGGEDFYFDINNRFYGCMTSPSSRKTSYFLFDLDGCDDRSFETIKKRLGAFTRIVYSYPTVSGYHIITDSFNYNILKKNGMENLVDCIKTNGSVLIAYQLSFID